MAKASSVPIHGCEFGKYSLAKTRPVTVLYRKKSYHSMEVPIVEAMTARRSCTWCSESPSGAVGKSVEPMAFLPGRPRRKPAAQSFLDGETHGLSAEFQVPVFKIEGTADQVPENRGPASGHRSSRVGSHSVSAGR